MAFLHLVIWSPIVAPLAALALIYVFIRACGVPNLENLLKLSILNFAIGGMLSLYIIAAVDEAGPSSGQDRLEQIRMLGWLGLIEGGALFLWIWGHFVGRHVLS